jgi:hypothetical protein
MTTDATSDASEADPPRRPVTNAQTARPRQSSVFLAPAPRSARELPQVPAHRGWADALGLFTVAFGAYAITSAGACLHLLDGPNLPWIYGWNRNAISVATGSLWIATIILRQDQRAVTRTVCLGSAAVTAAFAGWNVRSAAFPAELWDVLATIVCVGLCLLLAHRRGIGLERLGIAPRWAANKIGRGQGAEATLVSVLGNCTANYASYLILTCLPWLPEGTSNPSMMRGLVLIVHFTASSIIEETVLVAGVVTALEAARRPTWQIYALSLAMRVSFHLYYGSQAAVTMIFAAVNLWLFRRTRRLTPLIIAHIAYDAYASFGGSNAGPAINLVGLYSSIGLTAFLLVIAAKSINRRGDTNAPR